MRENTCARQRQNTTLFAVTVLAALDAASSVTGGISFAFAASSGNGNGNGGSATSGQPIQQLEAALDQEIVDRAAGDDALAS